MDIIGAIIRSKVTRCVPIMLYFNFSKKESLTMSDKKKENLLNSISIYLNNFVYEAEKNDSLDFFKIEINNHNGTLQIDHKFRTREKVY